MKPRFSILTLIGITAYVALNVAAIAQPTPVLAYLQFAVAALILLISIVMAAGQTSAAAVFFRAFLTSVVAYTVLSNWEPSFHPLLPGALRAWDANLFAKKGLSMEQMLAGHRSSEIITMNVQMATGIILGGVAVWRYRVLERQKNRPVS